MASENVTSKGHIWATWRFAPWVNRLLLAAATLIFTTFGLRYLTDPIRASGARGVTLSSALTSTTTQVGLGGFRLGIAIFSVACLAYSRRLVAGVSLVSTVVATAMVLRLFSITADGLVPKSTRLFIPETVVLLLSMTSLFMESTRRRHHPAEVV